MPVGIPGPIIVCLNEEHGVAPLVRCGAALALLSEAPLHLAFLLLIPVQRPLGILSWEEERRANCILDVAAEHAAESGVEATEEICLARSQAEAIQQMAEDLKASAVIVGWHGTGPLSLFDAGRTLLKAVGCSVIMIGQGEGRRQKDGWPPSWLLQSPSERAK